MQAKLPDGSVMVCGGCSRDAELEHVGQDGKRLCKVGLAVGKRPVQGSEKPETVWCNVVAWHNVAEVLSAARKGDAVLAVGRLQSREYNGKTYTDLVAEYVDVCAQKADVSGYSGGYGGYSVQARDNSPYPDQYSEFAELTTDDGNLPF